MLSRLIFPDGFCQCGCGRPTGIAKKTAKRFAHIKGQHFRYVHGHNGRKVERYTEDPETGCWNWQLYTDHRGYGYIGAHRQIFLAHRVFYEAYKGPIQSGLTIDHLCRNKACVNPAHLEAVSIRENCRRKPGVRHDSEIDEVRRLRVVERLSTQEIAEITGLSRTYVSNITAMFGRFRVDEIVKACCTCGASFKGNAKAKYCLKHRRRR